MKKNQIKRVWIERKCDDDPDISHLGKYSSKTGSGWHVDREAGKLLDEFGSVLADDLPTDYGRAEHKYIVDFQHSGTLKGWESQSDATIADAFLRLRYKANGNEQGLRGNLFEYFGVVGWQSAHSRADKVKLLDVVYCCLNAYRLYRMERQDWGFLGIIAKAEIVTPAGICQTLRSGGLWGVESDSGSDYLAEVEQEELEQLRSELEAMSNGFGKRAIEYAFKNVEQSH